MKNRSRYLQIYRSDLAPFLGALLFMLLANAAGAIKPWPMAWIIDGVLGQKPLPAWLKDLVAGQSKTQVIIALSASVFVFYALQGALTAAQNFISIKIGLRALARVREKLFEKLQRLSMRFYHGTSQGDVIYRATWDTYSFQTLFQQGLFSFLTAGTSLTIMSVVMWRLSPQLTLVALSTLPLLLLVMLFFLRKMKAQSTAAHQSDSAVSSLTQQTIAAMPMIQSFNRQPNEQQRFNRLAQTAYGKRARQHGWEVLYWLAMAVIFGGAAAAMAWLGSDLVLQNRLTIGGLTVFMAYLAQFYEPLNQLSHVGATVSDSIAGSQRVFEIMDAREELSEPADPESILGLTPRLSLEHVTFGYNPATPVLHDVSLVIKEHESVAIIGPSGAGKTTLLNLLPRFYDADSGTVRLGTMDVRRFRLADLRSQISIVFQEPILLAGTIRENIAFGKPDASPAEIEKAAKAAYAHDFIQALPQQYETQVGEGAARLSVGEKQRINLARAFLKDAPILLLDEPTSALDSQNEALVMRSLNQWMTKRTTALVTHRLAALRSVKKIIVLEQGRVVQFGSHDELLANPRGYYSLVCSGELQLGK